MKGFYLIFALSVLLCNGQQTISVKDPKKPLITFGSCFDLTKNPESKIFQHIIEQEPDAWIWLGDATNLPKKATEEMVLEYFMKTKSFPLYTELRSKTHVIGTWDVHDYSNYDKGNKNFESKERNKHLYLDFLDEPKDSSRRERDGVYQSYYLGEEKKVKIILLDVRYNRDVRFSFEEDMLGKNQWSWLEEELKQNEAIFTLIGSGTQFLPDDRVIPEQWYPESREKLLALIQKYKVNGVILLSGGAEFTEILRHPCKERVGYTLYEFTSSGLTHYISQDIPYGDSLFNAVYPHTFNTPEERFMEKNFAVLQFSFEEESPRAILEIKDEKGMKVLEKVVDYSELRFNGEILDKNSSCILNKNPYGRFGEKYLAEILSGNLFLVGYTLAFVGVLGICIYIALSTNSMLKFSSKTGRHTVTVNRKRD